MIKEDKQNSWNIEKQGLKKRRRKSRSGMGDRNADERR